MADLRKELALMDERYMGSDHILGKNLMCLTNRINSSRGNMWSSELDQVKVLESPEIARVFTGNENMVGRYSSAFYKLDSDITIIDKIVKFPESENAIYTLIIYDNEKKRYDIIERIPGVILTETYGYKFNNNTIDSLEIGDTVDAGEVLYASTSFDENMNYRYGVNPITMYTTDCNLIEDPIEISESFAKKCYSIEYDRVKISLNDNDILINMYGNRDLYRSFPDVGEEIIDSILAVKRRINYSQSFYDLKEENMRKILPSDTPYYIPFSEDKIVDISIYCNKNIDDIEETEYNRQILNYLDLDRSYNEELAEKLGKIIDGRERYTDDLAELYSRTSKIVDSEYKWNDTDKKIFSNMIIEFLVEKRVPVVVGSKFAGRSGDRVA